MKRILLAEPARDDVLALWEHAAEVAGLAVADRVVADFRAALRRLARTPAIGHARPELTPLDVRFYRVHAYLVVFRVAGRHLQVLRVLHGARDLSWLLRPRADEAH